MFMKGTIYAGLIRYDEFHYPPVLSRRTAKHIVAVSRYIEAILAIHSGSIEGLGFSIIIEGTFPYFITIYIEHLYPPVLSGIRIYQIGSITGHKDKSVIIDGN